MRGLFKKFQKKSIISVFLIFFEVFLLSAENYEIDYCGIFSDDLDLNMAKLTGDLYYTQLSEFQNYSVNDRRSEFSSKEIENLDTSLFSEEKKTFYVEICKKPSSDKWLVIFHISHQNKEFEKTKEYDSYYKILMEPKDNLRQTLSSLLDRKEGTIAAAPQNRDEIKNPAESGEKTSSQVSTEFLSGTWKGEDGLNKIVIMKGGRGFVIFSNGASMNITIKMNEGSDSKKIKVIQNQRSNASYFPELSREQALQHALDAQPIEWTLLAEDSNTLTGEKRTLVETGGQITYANLPVTWTRMNPLF